MAGRERAWFRAGRMGAWHAVERREDLLLRAACGYTRTWARSQQTRAIDPPDQACPKCLAELVRRRED
jgi:hypothetical protein